MFKLVILVFSLMFIYSCNPKNSSQKILGEWQHITDTSRKCNITQSGKNFIVEYLHRTYYDRNEDRVVYEGAETIPASYDKSKDKLIIKWVKNIDAVYDKNNDQLIFESWGAFRRIR